jgi:hypothetical protein
MSFMPVPVRRLRALLGGLLALVAVFPGAGVAAASGYTFKQIAEQTPNVLFQTLGGGFRMLNDAGEVVYAVRVDVSNLIAKYSGGVTTTVAGPPGFFGLNQSQGNGAIADNGSIAFSALVSFDGNHNAVYLDNDGSKTPLMLSEFDPNTDLPERASFAASTSPGGLVAFHGTRYDFPGQGEGGNNGYYMFSGGNIVTLFEDSPTTGTGQNAPVINDAGQVAFLTSANTGAGSGFSIVRYHNGSLTTVKSEFAGGHEIWMNSAGDVIYADVDEVSLYSSGVTTTIASTDDGFSGLMKPGNSDVFINDLDEVAFWGDVAEFNGQPVEWAGIYTGTDIVEDRVVRRGDTVLGHVVSGVEALGLNNAGQILFSVQAQSPDTWVALVLATPAPEGDFQEDGDVDDVDLALWDNNFGLATNALHMQGDADDDDDVDGRDFLIWQREYGTPAPAAAAVPEPGAAALTGISVGVALAISRRRGALTPVTT